MKIIITENQHRLLRRVSEIEYMIEPTMDLTYEYLQGDDQSPLNMEYYDAFIDVVTLKIANEIVNRTSFQGDEKEELKKQIKLFTQTNYISVIRDYFSSRLYKDKNINESTSNDKNKIFLKDEFGIDLDGKIKMIQSYEELPLIFTSHFYPEDFNRMLNDGGPFYSINITKGYKIGNQYVNKLYLYRPRVDGSSYLVDQDGYNKAESTFLENLGVDIIGLTIKDLVDIYFEE
jgi:hypothetical protein